MSTAARHVVVRDIAALPRDTDHDCWQLRPGPLRIDVALVPLPGLGIHYERADTLVRSRGVSPAGYLSIGLPLEGPGSARFNGADLGGSVVALGSRREMDCVVDRGGTLTIVLGEAGIRRLFLNVPGGAEMQARWRAAPVTVLRRQPGAASRLAALASGILADGCPPPGARLAADAILSLVERILLDAAPSAPHARRGRPSDRRRLALAAEAAILAPAARPLSVRDVCAATGASERSLEAAFREQFGATPIQYIRTVMLHRVRRDLLGAPPGATVTEVAFRNGFWHLSRFAGYYRAMFGERPSATLRRGGARGGGNSRSSAGRLPRIIG